jgi:putative oxidoreductase
MRSLKQMFPPRASYAMLPLRLALFATFFYHGTQKLFGWFGGEGIEGTAQFLGSLGTPVPSVAAYALAIAETFASISFLVGAGTRFFSMVVTVLMLGAIFTLHGANGWDFMNGGIEFQVAIIGMCLTLLFQGPGAGSIEWADEEGAAPAAVS